MANVLWLQGGACSGNTMSFLNAEEPTVVELITNFGVNILWHPSIGMELGYQVTQLLKDILTDKIKLDIFVYEGSVIQGPNGKGTMNFFCDRPMQEWVKELSAVAGYVVAIGDCAAFGGINAVAPNPSESTGLQFLKKKKGGFLGENFVSKGGLPVINIPGCPAHPDWVTQILVAISTGRLKDVLLDEYHRPKTFFTDFVQTGCPQQANFAQKVNGSFGQRTGCLFYEVGCRGSMTHSSCNKILWNRVSSKPRANHPCMGCTEPDYPHYDLAKDTVFKTPKYFGLVPKNAPAGQATLGYFIKAGMEKLWIKNKELTKTSK